MFEPISQNFFARHAAIVAPEILGSLLVRRLPDATLLRSVVVEVEAYSQEEAACHGHKSRTARNDVMFGAAGHSYVYFIYGMHFCMNIVTGERGQASGVLLRAVRALPETVHLPENTRTLSALGPGRLCKAYEITREHNGLLLERSSSLWLEAGVRPAEIVRSTRKGISAAQELEWRWVVPK